MVNRIERKKRIGREIAGIVFGALAVLVALSLYSRGDESSLVGSVGYWLSWGLFIAFGYSAYVFPILLLVLSAGFFMSMRGMSFKASAAGYLFIFICALSGLLGLFFVEVELAGGVVGSIEVKYLVKYLGRVGSAIVLTTVLAVFAMAATGLSAVQIINSAVRGAALVWGLIKVSSLFVGSCFRSLWGLLYKEPMAAETRARRRAPEIITKGSAQTKPRKKSKKQILEEVQDRFDFLTPEGSYRLPPLSLLDPPADKSDAQDEEAIYTNSKILEKKLDGFDVQGSVVSVMPGPVVTMYEFEPAPGIKVGKIVNLSDDLALALRAYSIRIVAPIPGKAVVGIEVPNTTREMIVLREILECREYSRSRSKVTLALGRDLTGVPFVADLTRMPHLLVAGATGAGKSVFINAMILSILYKATPDDVRLLMIDPKMLELSAYEGIPHLLTPVVTDVKRANLMLRSMVAEMGKRYRFMAEKGVKNIDKYNRMIDESDDNGAEEEGDEGAKRLPHIVVIIDELADLMLASGKDVEESLVRLSQMARAAGIHLIVATQRPSVDVVTGLIKTNFPARLSFQMPTRTDSRTIIDTSGAEKLLGDGDMLYLAPGTTRLKRVHGPYVSEPEIARVVEFWKKQGDPDYDEAIVEAKEVKAAMEEEDLGEEFMGRYREALEITLSLDMISTSYIQRRLRIGYNTAARIIERMEAAGIVGPSQGSRPREVLGKRDADDE